MTPSLPTDIENIVETIRRDHESGAIHLTGQATEAFLRLADAATHADLRSLRDQVIFLGQQLMEAQPSMAPIHVLAMRCRRICEATLQADMPQSLSQTATEFQSQMANSLAHISTFAIPLIPRGSTVLTLSSSTTVTHVLQAAQQAGKDLQVVCTESRPQNEGLVLARTLAESGIPVTLTLDTALAEWITGGIVMVGADACMPAGIINKIGTRTLVLLAGMYDSPCYTLCGQEKFLPATWATGFRIADQDPHEILPKEIRGVTVINRYFDATPLHWFSGVVTDEGCLSAADVLRKLVKMESHPPTERKETDVAYR